MAERQYTQLGNHILERKLNLYEFTKNEIRYKEIYESEYGYLLMTPMDLEQLKDMLGQYPFLPQLYDFYEAFENKASDGRYNIDGFDLWDDSEIYMCQHERYCYPLIHTHNYVEALYVYDGNCRQLICGKLIELHKGDFCILSPDAPHCVLAYDDNNIIINFLIQKSMFNSAFFDVLCEKHLLSRFFNDILYNNDASPYIIFPTGEDGGIRAIVDRMYREDYYRRKYFGRFLTAYFQELILYLLRNYEVYAVVPSPVDTRLNTQIVAILNYIHVNYSHVTIKELARFFNYSENYLSKLLKEYTGETFSNLISEIQMNHAVRFLCETDMSLQEIALEVGCFDLSHFGKKFKKRYGVTPTKYRKDHLRST